MKYIDSLEYESIPDYDHIYYCIQHAAKVPSFPFPKYFFE